MRVLVTGSTGRIGSRLVPRLLHANLQLRLLVRNPARADAFARRGAEVVTGDLRDPAAVRRALEDVYAVVHLAAADRKVPEAEIADVNQSATAMLASLSRSRRFIFASTHQVYGAGRGRPAREDDELHPPATAAYARSKALAEESLRALHRDGLDLRILRLGPVYGEGDPTLRETLEWARAWSPHKRLHLVHHADVGQATLRALAAEGIDGGVYNIADDAPITTYELHALQRTPVPEELARRPLDDPWEGLMDTSCARTQLGFRPIFPSVYAAQDAGAL